MTINYAHRGASGCCPENTILAFEKALEMGCTGIETDVQMTKDGTLVLIHDETVNRTTNGTGFVKDFTYAELRALDAGSWMKKDFSSQYIPTAEELICLVKDRDIIINFELKNGIVPYDGMEELLLKLIKKHNMESKVIISSFNHYSAVKFKSICPAITTGLLYSDGLFMPEKYANYVGADALHPHYYSVNDQIIKEVKKADILVNIYTVNDEDLMKHLLNLNIDGIITNYPDKLKRIIDSKDY